MTDPQKILIIQTAFLGDVVLATSLVEQLRRDFGPDLELHFLLRKGNEAVLEGAPLQKVWIWDKKQKWKSWNRLRRELRQEKFDLVLNLQRFFSTGLLTVLLGAKETRGFDKSPLRFLFTKVFPHTYDGQHETDRLHALLKGIGKEKKALPRIYPQPGHFEEAVQFTGKQPYVVMAPGSVWFTKALPPEKWVELIHKIPADLNIFLSGSPGERALCEQIAATAATARVTILAGNLSLLGTAALMKGAVVNYTNDSAPTHFCSALDAPNTVFFCSTLPAFGFGPLASDSNVLEISKPLYCRPCGIHGYKACPQGHFRCAYEIEVIP